MTVIFLGPLVMSVAAACMLSSGDFELRTKIAAWSMVTISLLVQFVLPMPDVARMLVPLFLQMGVIVWWYVASNFA